MSRDLSTFCFLITLALLPLAVEGILCYQCATTATEDRCIQDYMAFVNDSRGLTNTFIKDCTDTNPKWDRCMIETREQNGVLVHFHRGCHDGEFFHDDFDSDRFKNVTPNNETTCAHVKTLTCYTFCVTDLCNGPQAPPNRTTCDDLQPHDWLEPGVTCSATPLSAVGRLSGLGLLAIPSLVSALVVIVYSSIVG